MSQYEDDTTELMKAFEAAGFKVVEVSGGIWATAPIEQEPSITLTNWQIKETTIGNFFSGWNVYGREGRASTKIVTYDPVTKKGVTESGRVYQLKGDPGYNSDAEYVWARYKRINNLVELSDVPVLDEVVSPGSISGKTVVGDQQL